MSKLTLLALLVLCASLVLCVEASNKEPLPAQRRNSAPAVLNPNQAKVPVPSAMQPVKAKSVGEAPSALGGAHLGAPHPAGVLDKPLILEVDEVPTISVTDAEKLVVTVVALGSKGAKLVTHTSLPWYPLTAKDNKPVFHMFREFPVGTMRLEFQLTVSTSFAVLASKSYTLTVVKSVSDLLNGAAKISLNLEDKKGHTATLTVNRIDYKPNAAKTVFIIRHGESVWNQGEHEKSITKLVGKDHPLNDVGIGQAKAFNEKWRSLQGTTTTPFLEDFLKATKVFASPLTRATETAVLTLQSHPAIKQNGIFLLKSAREKKNKVGLDTVGKVAGMNIAEHVKSLLKEANKAAGVVEMPELHPYTASGRWWTPLSESDSEDDLAQRYEDFLSTLRFAQDETIIAVGHSLFFQGMFQRFGQAAAIDAKFRDMKLGNAAGVCVKFDFAQTNTGKFGKLQFPQFITNADLIFGSTFFGGALPGNSNSNNQQPNNKDPETEEDT